MQLFLLILISSVVVVLLIRILHVIQLRKSHEIADQGMPLPPLPPQKYASSNAKNTLDSGLTVSAKIATDSVTPKSWKDEVKSLRDAGRFKEALSLCSRQYPRMLAFRQTMITLRSQLKVVDEVPEQSLLDIYKTAILASLAKSVPTAVKNGSDLITQLPLLDDPRTYWDKLGYANLELLSKTDCNLLIKHWGEPTYHGDIQHLLKNSTTIGPS